MPMPGPPLRLMGLINEVETNTAGVRDYHCDDHPRRADSSITVTSWDSLAAMPTKKSP